MSAKSLIPLVLALLLTGCASVPFVTQWKLRDFKLMTANVPRLRVALRARQWVMPTPDRAALIIAIRELDEDERQSTIHLRQARYVNDTVELARLAKDAASLVVYEVDPRDLRLAAELQSDAVKANQQGIKRKGTLKLSGVACRNGPEPDDRIAIDVYLHPDDETGWLPLVEDYDLHPKMVGAEAMKAFDEAVPSCARPQLRSTPQAAR